MIANRRGQALIESVIAAPLLIAALTAALGGVFHIAQCLLLSEALDETLVCQTQRSTTRCRAELLHFVQATKLSRARPVFSSSREVDGSTVLHVDFEDILGGKHRLSRELPRIRSDSFRLSASDSFGRTDGSSVSRGSP